MLIKAPRLFVLCMHGESADAGYFRRLQCALHRVSHKRLANALPLPTAINRESGKQHDGYRMLRKTFLQALRGIFRRHLANGQSVIANNDPSDDTHISLRRTCLLVLPGIP